jgi:hypothetical protein
VLNGLPAVVILISTQVIVGTQGSSLPLSVPVLLDASGDVEAIPHYLDAHNIVTDTTHAPQSITVRYETSAASTTIADYYKDVLHTKSWMLMKEYTREDICCTQYKTSEIPGVEFSWSDKKQIVPWRLNLFIGISSLSNGSSVDLILWRIPIIGNIPIHPHAEQTVITETVAKDGIERRHISFTASDPPTVIISYYRDMLSQHGWTPLDLTSQDIAGVLHFGYFHSDGKKLIVGNVFISVTSEEASKTTVKIDAEETSEQ